MKRTLAIFLVLIMSLGTVTGAFAANGEFEDVKTTDWFYNDVKTAVELGLVNGRSATSYAPNDNLTYAEAIKLAACMNQLYTTGAISIQGGDPWYMPYVEYCKANNIINKEYNYSENATRSGYMEIFANALPSDGLAAINTVADNSIPDVPSSAQYAEGVYKLYRAGILQGVDAAHNCSPLSNIRRCEVATILTRMMNKDKRVTFTMGEETSKVTSPLKIEKQPENASIDLGETAVFSVEATGGTPEYSYQWYYQSGNYLNKLENGNGVAGATSANLSMTINNSISIKLVCEVKDADGTKVLSKKVELHVVPEKLPLEIETQPVDTTVAVGADAVVCVKAKNGVGDYTYQWQMNIGPSWVRISDNEMISGTTTDTLTLKSVAASYIEVRCVVRDSAGNAVESKGVKVTFE